MNLEIENIKKLAESKNAKGLLKITTKYLKLLEKPFSKAYDYNQDAVKELLNKALLVTYPDKKNVVANYILKSEPDTISFLELYCKQTQDIEIAKAIVKKAIKTKGKKVEQFMHYLSNLIDFNISVLSQIDNKDVKYLLNIIEKKLSEFELEDGDIILIINLFKNIKSKEKEPFIIKVLKGADDEVGSAWVGEIIRNDEMYVRKDEIETLLMDYLREQKPLNSFSDDDKRKEKERREAVIGLTSLNSVNAIPNMVKVIKHVAEWRWYQNSGDDARALIYVNYFYTIKENIPESMIDKCIEYFESIRALDYSGIGSLPHVQEIKDKCNVIINHLKVR